MALVMLKKAYPVIIIEKMTFYLQAPAFIIEEYAVAWQIVCYVVATMFWWALSRNLLHQGTRNV